MKHGDFHVHSYFGLPEVALHWNHWNHWNGLCCRGSFSPDLSWIMCQYVSCLWKKLWVRGWSLDCLEILSAGIEHADVSKIAPPFPDLRIWQETIARIWRARPRAMFFDASLEDAGYFQRSSTVKILILVNMDWFKGNFTEKTHIYWENRWFPVDFPLNQSIDLVNGCKRYSSQEEDHRGGSLLFLCYSKVCLYTGNSIIAAVYPHTCQNQQKRTDKNTKTSTS